MGAATAKPRGPRYRPVMTLAEVLEILRAGHYRVDTETGEVRGPKGIVKPYPSKSRSGQVYWFVRLYRTSERGGQQKCKAIAVHRLVWMMATQSEIPTKFEIHHEDEDSERNGFDNLICLHKLDHRKQHRRDYDPSEVPF